MLKILVLSNIKGLRLKDLVGSHQQNILCSCELDNKEMA